MKKVVFVGITDKNGKEPFDSSTKSGQIIDLIIKELPCCCEKINYISYAPLDELGKLRYPTKGELSDAFPFFQQTILQLSPDLIVICGNMIFDELKRHSFSGWCFLKIKHPSYVWVYHRKELDGYINETVKQINKIIS